MNKLHEKLNNDNVVPKEGQRDFLCSNNLSTRCPSLGINEEEQSLDCLAGILVEAFIKKKKYEHKSKK